MEVIAEKFKTYDSVKDSGLEWIREIPVHWKLIKLKFISDIKKRIIGYEGPEVLSITQKGIKVKNILSGEGQLAQDYSKYQIVKKGDFAMNHMDLLTGWIDISKHNGVISPDYRVFEIVSNKLDKRYLLWMFQHLYSTKVFYAHGQGVSMLGRWRFPAENFKNFFIPIPPYEEQNNIAIFLDEKSAKIDKAIAQKEKLIELLKERRQIIIQNAVTKGLNSNAKMKSSGIDWIGEIPEHWEVRKLKFLCKTKTGDKNTEDKIENGAYPFFVRSQKPERINSYSFEGEAILTAGDGAGVGKVYHYINGKFDYHQRVYKFSDFKLIKGELLFHYLKELFYNAAMLGTAKSTVDSLRLPLIQSFEVAFPKKESEQSEQIDFIKKVNNKIEGAIEAQANQITQLKEYKSVLIDSAVTGKIKV